MNSQLSKRVYRTKLSEEINELNMKLILISAGAHWLTE